MRLSEVTLRTEPTNIFVHDVDDMQARVFHYQGSVWLSLGAQDATHFREVVSFFFHGEDALERAERLAAAINGAMATSLKVAAE